MLQVCDVPRMCLFDSWFSSVIVGRSVATIAELCFVAQWSLLLWEIAQFSGSRICKASAQLIVQQESRAMRVPIPCDYC